ncbi:NAD-dependent epimerase/dehydratase family protein, partial [Methylobacterium frigidaeris]
MSGRRPVLITGGAGFIGANLADALAAEGRDVLVY